MAESKKKLPIDPTTLSYARELRRASTSAERTLWSMLRGKQLLGLKSRRQHPLPPYIVDFYCHKKRLVVELDGGQHNEVARTAYDLERTAWLQAQGLRVIRFWNHEVEPSLEGALVADAWMRLSMRSPTIFPWSSKIGTTVPRERMQPGFSSLAT